MTCTSIRPEPVDPASCGGSAPPADVRPGDTVETLGARIRAERCGGRQDWAYAPEEAARQMLWAEAQRKRLTERYP